MSESLTINPPRRRVGPLNNKHGDRGARRACTTVHRRGRAHARSPHYFISNSFRLVPAARPPSPPPGEGCDGRGRPRLSLSPGRTSTAPAEPPGAEHGGGGGTLGCAAPPPTLRPTTDPSPCRRRRRPSASLRPRVTRRDFYRPNELSSETPGA